MTMAYKNINHVPLKMTDNGDGTYTLFFDLGGASITLGDVGVLDTSDAQIDPALKSQLPASPGQKTKAASLAVTLASDEDLIALLPTALTGSGNLKVAIQEALPAGANAVGKLAANSGVDIGDVDVLSIAAGSNIIGKVGIDQTTSGTTDRVTAKVDKLQGAANMANGQVAAGVAAGTLVAARATRRSVVIKNMDTSITVYIGVATVTTANGLPLLAGESVSIDWVGLIQVIAASGTPGVAYCETFD